MGAKGAEVQHVDAAISKAVPRNLYFQVASIPKLGKTRKGLVTYVGLMGIRAPKWVPD